MGETIRLRAIVRYSRLSSMPINLRPSCLATKNVPLVFSYKVAE